MLDRTDCDVAGEVAAANGVSPSLAQRMGARERPGGGAVMFQTWRDLLFVHRRYDPRHVQPTLPPGLTVDTFDGSAWIGCVPFLMRRIRPAWFPAVPGISNFLELNLRTYVFDRHGTPGVWFYSLDANGRPAVHWGRRFFQLPYHHARMSFRRHAGSGRVEYTSARRGAARALTTRFVYVPSGALRRALPGTLESFLVERYILFTVIRGGLCSGQVSHDPYSIRDVEVLRDDENLLRLQGLRPVGGPPAHAVYSPGVDVEVFRPAPV